MHGRTTQKRVVFHRVGLRVLGKFIRNPMQNNAAENGMSQTKYRGACHGEGRIFLSGSVCFLRREPYAGAADESEWSSLAPLQSRNRQMQSQLAPIRTRENDEPQATQR
jgi:hypothetical protein